MDMRRFLPIMLIAFAALFILPQLFRGSSSKTLSAKDRGVLTRDAMLRIDKAEKAAFARNGRYTGNLADLVVADKVLAQELTVPLTIDIEVGSRGTSYVVRVSSDVLSVARARTGDKVVASNCRVLKSSSSVKCPEPAATTTTTTTTAPTTTG
jgi:hypothetical protein